MKLCYAPGAYSLATPKVQEFMKRVGARPKVQEALKAEGLIK